jgi:ribosomal protein S18 acetylase RimI-like enzyme
MIIRDATIADAPALAALMNVTFGESGAFLDDCPPHAAVLAQIIKSYQAGAGVFLVAVFNYESGGRPTEEVIGWIEVAPYRQSRMRHAGNIAMGVGPGLRGRGIGSSLLAEALLRSRSLGLRILHLEVDASNIRAHALYRKYGFAVDGVRRLAKHCPSTGRYHDLVLMSRLAP